LGSPFGCIGVTGGPSTSSRVLTNVARKVDIVPPFDHQNPTTFELRQPKRWCAFLPALSLCDQNY